MPGSAHFSFTAHLAHSFYKFSSFIPSQSCIKPLGGSRKKPLQLYLVFGAERAHASFTV